MSEEITVLSPDEVAQRRARKKAEVEAIPEITKNETKFYNKGVGQAYVQFESQGRFDIPLELGFKDFNGSDINSIVLSRREDLLENIVTMLQKNIVSDGNDAKIENMTMEEFLETLVAIKRQYNTHIHKHLWLCSCQSGVNEDEQHVNETEVNLNNIKYQSIAEADEEFKKIYKEDLDALSNGDWNTFVKNYYKGEKDADTWTREDEVNRVTIKEPIRISDEEGNVYAFRLTRIKDLIIAQKMAMKKFGDKIIQVQKKQVHGVPLVEMKAQKAEEIKKIETERDKSIVLYAKAMSLISVNGKELSNQEKIDTYSNLSRSLLLDFISFLDKIKFGIYDDIELACPLCGKVSKESLRQELDILQLLPLDTDTDRKCGKLSRLNISFGD